MPDHHPDGPMDDASFQSTLQAVIRSGHENGIDIEGHWTCSTETGEPTWDVEIVPVATLDEHDG